MGRPKLNGIGWELDGEVEGGVGKFDITMGPLIRPRGGVGSQGGGAPPSWWLHSIAPKCQAQRSSPAL